MKKTVSLIFPMIIGILITAASLATPLSPQAASTQIRALIAQQGPNGWTETQLKQVVRVLNRWKEGLAINDFKPQTASYNQLIRALDGWMAWQQTVNSLGLTDHIKEAKDVYHKDIEAAILPVAKKIYHRCKYQHDINQLKNLINLSQLVGSMGFENVDTNDIHDMFTRCAHFKLSFQSEMSWSGANRFQMDVKSEVPFKATMEKQHHLGAAPLNYTNFTIENDEDHNCNPIPYGTENGRMEVNDFTWSGTTSTLTLMPTGNWEKWGTTSGCEHPVSTRSGNWLTLWHVFQASEQTKPGAKRPGYTISDWRLGHGKVIAIKHIKRSLLQKGILLHENTLIKIWHTPK